MILDAQQIYNRLINEDRILESKGRIRFDFSNISIVVRQKDVVGNIMQEWVQGWFDSKGVEYALSDNTQLPPDFFLNPADLETGLLEVKAFNRSATPGFDIADFRMYEEEIIERPYMLDADYLIFGYDMTDGGVVTVRELWLKKVWEITRRMKDWPINLQVKKGEVHKIRPGVWYSGNKGYIPMFRCVEDFLSALEETVYRNPKTHTDAGSWKSRFLDSYERHYGARLRIPRWDEIADTYGAEE